jgi:tetratricopeptide (TPR) repeat protein
MAALLLIALCAAPFAGVVRAETDSEKTLAREAKRAERERRTNEKRAEAARRAEARRAAAAERALAKEARAREQKPDREPASAAKRSLSQLEDAHEQAALDPAQPYWPYRIGELRRAAHAPAAAESAYRAALGRDPDYAPALAALSALWYDARRHDDAIEMLETARTRAAARPGGLDAALAGALALQYEAAGRPNEARAALAQVPDAHRTAARGAFVYLTLRGDRPDAAAGAAEDAAGREPGSAVNQNNFGIARLRAGDVERAEKAFLKAIDLDPALAGPYYNLAILTRYYRYDETAAARWFEAYRRHGKADPDSLGRALARREGAESVTQGR